MHRPHILIRHLCTVKDIADIAADGRREGLGKQEAALVQLVFQAVQEIFPVLNAGGLALAAQDKIGGLVPGLIPFVTKQQNSLGEVE